MSCIAIVGLGLIGGSLARAFKAYTPHTVIGLDISEEVLQFAHSVGAIDQIGRPSDLAQADITFLCLYPGAVVEFVKRNKTHFKKDSIVTDTAGVKGRICASLDAETLPFTFIGGHPMAGREVGGFENSTPDLFQGASYIFTPKAGCRAQLCVLEDLARQLHFAKTVVTTPKEHDEMIAFTSQIAHALACAYILSPRAKRHDGFSAGSFRDVSRVAKINETLWTELFLENKDALLQELDTLCDHLSTLRGYLAAGDGDALKAMLRRGRECKEALDQ